MQNQINIMKKIIIIFVIIILIILTLLAVALLTTKKEASNTVNENISKQEINNNSINSNNITIKNNNTIVIEENKTKKSIAKVKDYKTFYTVQNCVSKFESYANLDYTKKLDELGYPSLAAEYGIYNEVDKNQAILDFLDEEFVKKYNITINNITDYVKTSMYKSNVEVLAVNKLIDIDTSVKAYSVYAKKTINNNSEYTFYIVKMINENVFCIHPIQQGVYSNIDEIIVENNTKFIEKNTRNGYVKSTINEGQIIAKYFQEYKENMLNNPNEAYLKLDKEYREKRFGTLENFKEYIRTNSENIRLMQLYRYDLKEYNEYREYTVKDRFENFYIFYEVAPKEYTVMLDDYTVPTESYKQQYQTAPKEYKSLECANKFIKMINNKDYENAYKLLNDTFKSNNFSNIEGFKNVINQKFYNMNYIIKSDVTNKDEYYVVRMIISDNNADITNSKTINFIINLIDSSNFEMSFDFEE